MSKNPVLFLSIVKEGLASKFLKEAQVAGATGGTILRSEGTVSNVLMNLLGLRDVDREVVFTLVNAEKEDKIHSHLKEKMRLDRKGNGIMFSLNTSSCIGNQHLRADFEEDNNNMQGHQMIVTIVDRTLGDSVVEAARDVGATGATILHGRGIGAHEKGKIFNIKIEPEKEIVLMIVENNRTSLITDVISDTMNIKAPGKGIIFTMDINAVTGLFQDN